MLHTQLAQGFDDLTTLCTKLIETASVSADLAKPFVEVKKEIERIENVEKCLILKLQGRTFTDGREYNIPSDESFLEELSESYRDIIINDTSRDKVLQKELHKYFRLKVSNMLLVPILQKK